MGRIFERFPRGFNNIQENGVDAGWKSLARSGSVGSRTVIGTAWIVFWRFANRALGIISTLILARLLAPSDFGVVALAMSFVQGLQQLADLGTENVIIRADMPDRELYNTGFTINVLRGFAVGGLMALAAVPLGNFFNTPHLSQVIFVAAAVSAISSLRNIGIVDYRRYMAFDREFVFKIVPRVLSVTTAITLAFALRDYWALIIAILVNVCAGTILSYVLHPYRPRLTLRGWSRMASYSTLLWASNIVALLGTLGTRSIISKLLSVSSLGLFEVASDFANLPSTELIHPLARAMFAGFSEVRGQADGGADLWLRVMTTMNMIVLPLAVGLSLVAEPAVRLAFGEKWLGAIPLLQILALGQTITIFGQMGRQAFAVHGWMKALLKVTLTVGLVQITLLILLILYMGMPGIAVALVANSAAGGVFYLAVTMQRLRISWRRLLSRLWRSFLAVGLMTLVLDAAGLGWFNLHATASDAALAFQLLEIIAIGALTYAASLLVLWLAAGRPDGPEREVLDYVGRSVLGKGCG